MYGARYADRQDEKEESKALHVTPDSENDS